MSDLNNRVKVVLADTFCMYLKAHNFHWNVTGPNFTQYHQFFADIYNELWLAVDAIAEHIRAINDYAPGGLERFKELSSIKDEIRVLSAEDSVRELLADNLKVIASLKEAYKDAEEADELGLSNFLQDRLDIHAKLGWMLRASIART